MKNRKKYISYLLAFSIGLNSSQFTYFSTKIEGQDTYFKEFESPKEKFKDHLKKIKLDDLKQEISRLEVHYNYESFYPKENMIDLIVKEQNQKICTNQNANLSELAIEIIQNSLQDEKSVFIPVETKKKGGKEEIEKDTNMRVALKMALKNAFKCPSNQLEDMCHMKTLKILNQTFENKKVLAKYDEKSNTIYIDYNKIETNFQNTSHSDKKEFIFYLARNLEHELNHCREFKCDCRKNENSVTNIASFRVLKFLIEASAESGTYNFNSEIMHQTTSKDYSYYDYRKEEANLLFLVLFKENKTLEAYYQTIFNSDIQGLFTYFDIETREEARTFLNITYSIDALLKENDLYYYLAEQYGNIYTEQEIKEKIGYAYKLDIYKIALKDLIDEISKKKIDLNETLYLYNFLKSYLLIDTSTYKENTFNFNPSFLESINQLENYFYTYIKEYFNTTDENIKEMEKKSLYSFINFNQNETQLERESIFQNLVEKYPLLKTIAWTHSSTVFNLFDNQLTLKKELNS